VTSTRGKGIFAVLAVCAALLVPSAASAGNSYSTGSSALERAPFTISFTSLTRNGHIVAVKQFKFSGFDIKCDGKPGELRGRAPRRKVVNRKFHSVIHKKTLRIYVKGTFRHHGQKVNGSLRVAGKFGSATCYG
jgi:hypothetical protein